MAILPIKNIEEINLIKTWYKKSKHNEHKKNDRDIARRNVLDFLKSKNVDLCGTDFWAIKKDFRILGISLYRIEEDLKTERHLLFSVPIFEV